MSEALAKQLLLSLLRQLGLFEGFHDCLRDGGSCIEFLDLVDRDRVGKIRRCEQQSAAVRPQRTQSRPKSVPSSSCVISSGPELKTLQNSRRVQYERPHFVWIFGVRGDKLCNE